MKRTTSHMKFRDFICEIYVSNILSHVKSYFAPHYHDDVYVLGNLVMVKKISALYVSENQFREQKNKPVMITG